MNMLTGCAHTPDRRGNAVRTQTPRRARTALGGATLCLTLACGGGGTGTLHDLIADASENAEIALNNLETARAEVEEATNTGVSACAERYSRPEGMHWRPRYADRLPIPEGIDPDPNAMDAVLRRITCNNTPTRLERIRATYDRMISSLTEFEMHAETMRDANRSVGRRAPG